MSKKGKLYLIPTPLGEEGEHVVPTYAINILHQLDIFIAERAKTARRFIKSTQPKRPISELQFQELNKYTTPEERQTYLDEAEKGRDIGLLSEAGCPGVADPGAVIVRMAHQKGIEVIPLVGPSSILLALMASGMNGQNFSFQGYLPPKTPALIKELKRLEQLALKWDQTQLFIETPYRNNNLVEQALKVLSPQTRFGIAADLTLPTQFILTHNIQTWRKIKAPNLHKRPAIFLIGK